MNETKPNILLISGVIAPTFGLFWKYFSIIPDYLKNKGMNVYIVDLPAWGTMAERSKLIDQFIENNFNNKSFYVIGHSKGGIDMRYLLQKKSYRIKGFFSLSCPYKGSLIAMVYYHLFKFSPFFKNIKNTLFELRPNHLKNYWNDQYCNFPTFYVDIYLKPPTIFKTYPIFIWGNLLIRWLNKLPNDGFVDIESAKWGEKISELHSDHIGVIGHFFYKIRKISFLKTYDKIAEKIFEIH